ncbi:MAG: transcriptional regulator [bacterium]|nr:transcriptional regulator [bacterium]
MREKIVLLSSTGLGSGDQQLGELIMANFLRLLPDQPNPPKKLICWNAAVKLLTTDSPVFNHLQKIESAGIEILACRTCVEFFGLEEKIAVGKISTMQVIQQLLLENDVITV